MANEQNNPAAPQIPSLDAIEREGDLAARQLAQKLVDQTVARKGAVNFDRLRRAGPHVRRIYLQLLADQAAPPAETKKGAAQPAGAAAKSSPKAPAPMAPTKVAASDSLLPPSLQRAEQHWFDRCRDAPDFSSRAFRRGLIVAAFAAILAAAAIRFFDL